MIRVIPFDPHYRDDMIFMVLLARDALGIPIRIREDLLDVQTNYLDRGDGFWLAVNDEDRVVGCVGYNRIGNSDAAYLHRFFVKPSMKRRGIGSQLLQTAENAMRSDGIHISKVHLGAPESVWFESYAFYPKHGYAFVDERYMQKEL